MNHEKSEPRPGATGATRNELRHDCEYPLFDERGQADGERRRDAALARVALRRPADVWQAQAAMLAAALDRDPAAFTSDDASEPGIEYRGNAPWIGAAVRELAHRRFVADGGFQRSTRPSRKANHVRRWVVTDRDAAAAELARLRRLLGAVECAAGDRG